MKVVPRKQHSFFLEQIILLHLKYELGTARPQAWIIKFFTERNILNVHFCKKFKEKTIKQQYSQ